MTDHECVEFLHWALPRLGLRWSGFRKVRGQVCKRLKRRLAELSVEDVASYRARLECDASEWEVLEFGQAHMVALQEDELGVERVRVHEIVP